MILLALDPSSTMTGYAVLRGPLDLLDAGVLRPVDGDVIVRAESMAADLPDLVAEHRVERAIIEIPAPQAPNPRNNRGQANYGMAVGIILVRLRLLVPAVEFSRADVWTRRVKKRHRQLCVANDFPGYELDRDRGADCADAVALGQWWFTQREVNAA